MTKEELELIYDDLSEDYDDLQDKKEAIEAKCLRLEEDIDDLKDELKSIREFQETYDLMEAYNIDPNNLDFQMKLEYFLSECRDMRSCDFEEMVKNYKNK